MAEAIRLKRFSIFNCQKHVTDFARLAFVYQLVDKYNLIFRLIAFIASTFDLLQRLAYEIDSIF